ncbi:PepSY domain-containing protein [Streptomyces sp. NPDC007100]|uniref:PepSY domain-containing protein n=1 Tax=Streptomyces sp. NPDC007100 TaxID=3155602 RepID=UPI0033F5DDBB
MNTYRMGRNAQRTRATAALVALLTASAVLVGCGDDNDKGGEASGTPKPSATPTTSGPLTEDQRSRKALIPAAKTSYNQALKAATAAVEGSKPVAVELKRGAGGKPEWHAKVATEDGTASSVRVDAVSGKADRPRAEDEDGDDKKKLADRLRRATVTAQQAVATATGKKSGTVSAVELDDNDQKKEIWSVDVVTKNDWNKTTFDVDATDRKILREHVDRD